MVDLVQWWYLRGFRVFVLDLKSRLGDTADFFSIGQLLRTFFMPYRQISAAANAESSGGVMNAFFDRLISRIIGAFTRFFIIIFGSVVLLLEVVIGAIMIVAWPFAPLAVIAGIVMSIMGVTL